MQYIRKNISSFGPYVNLFLKKSGRETNIFAIATRQGLELYVLVLSFFVSSSIISLYFCKEEWKVLILFRTNIWLFLEIQFRSLCSQWGVIFRLKNNERNENWLYKEVWEMYGLLNSLSWDLFWASMRENMQIFFNMTLQHFPHNKRIIYRSPN
jgi:hypothetical protein